MNDKVQDAAERIQRFGAGERGREWLTRSNDRDVRSFPGDGRGAGLHTSPVDGLGRPTGDTTQIVPPSAGLGVDHITLSGSDAGSSGVEWDTEAGEPRHRRGFASTSLPTSSLTLTRTGEMRFTARGLTSGDTLTVEVERGGSTVGAAVDYTASSAGEVNVAGGWQVQVGDTATFTVDAARDVEAEVSVIGAPGTAPPLIEGDLWIHGDVDDKTIYLLNVGESSAVRTITSPIEGDDCQGMDYRGGFLWLDDKDVEKVHKVDPADGSVVSSFTKTSTNLYCLAKTDAGMWMIDSTNFPSEWVLLSDGGSELDRTDNDPGGGQDASGDWYTATWDGTYVWASYAFASFGWVEPSELLRFDPSGPSETTVDTDLPDGEVYALAHDGTNVIAVRQYPGSGSTLDVYSVSGTTSTLLGTVPSVTEGIPICAWMK